MPWRPRSGRYGAKEVKAGIRYCEVNRKNLSRAWFELYRLSSEWTDRRFHSRRTQLYLSHRTTLAKVGQEVFGRESAEVMSYVKEFRELAEATHYTLAEVGDYRAPYALNFGISAVQMETLFVVVRMAKPETVLETGVANGLSSTAILAALDRNGAGRLYSVDPGEGLGCLIPERLRSRWVLINHASPDALYHFTGHGEVDLFHHDSLHLYRQMHAEFEAAARLGSDRLVVMSDDVLANDAFHDFCSSRALPYFILGQEEKFEGFSPVGPQVGGGQPKT